MIDLTHHRGTKGYIIQFDFEKAFDKVDHEFLIKTLRAFNFGERMIHFIQNIYTDIKGKVINNGYLTEDIHIGRGIRQGCPLSLPLYVMVAEVLAIQVRKKQNIKGFHIPGRTKETKNILFADDNTALLTTPISIDEMFKEFDKFEEASGCNLNKDKIKGLIIGKKPYCAIH